MGKQIPKDWTTLNVASDFRLKGSYPQNLRIKRLPHTPILYAEWLPAIEDDHREHQGRSKGGKGKRLTIRISTETSDPHEAAKVAVKLWEKKQDEFRQKKDEEEGKTKNPFSYYWDKYFFSECKNRESTNRNFNRWKRDEVLKWEAEEWGLSQQPWSQRSVDLITASDFKEYFDLIEKRSRKLNRTNGSGMKGQQKTLINKLLRLAEDDFPGHSFPSFPKISKQKNQVRHFNRPQWDLLLKTVFELGGESSKTAVTPKQYQSLEFSYYNRNNIRNWVDLHDALFLMWFFYLRPEDMYRLKSEWFVESGDEWICNLETTKKDRPRHQTTHYRGDAPLYLKRIFGRKPSGYAIFPHLKRPLGNPADSGVLGNLNFLLKHAIDLCLPDFPVKERKWMTLRHTALRLTLEDDRDLWIPPDINSFAENAHTSPQMLRETYINYIESESTAKKSRKKIKSGNWSLQRGRISDQIN